MLTYKVLRRSIGNYIAPVWNTNASDTSIDNIQRTQNGANKMSSIEHLNSETKMLPSLCAITGTSSGYMFVTTSPR